MTFLLTGCAGFIGYHTTKKLLNEGFTVYGIDNLNHYYDVNLKLERLLDLKKNSKFTFFDSDINNLKKLKFKKINIIIHFAAQAGVRLPKQDSQIYIDSNISGFISVLNFCNDMSIQKLIYASSSSVYSGCCNVNFKEDIDLGKPKSLYAATKIFDEYMAEIHTRTNNFQAIGLRLFTVYGSWGRPDMAYYSFTEKIKKDIPITVFGNGSLKRDMTHINDVVQGIISSVYFLQQNDQNSHEIFNLGNEKPVSTLDLIRIVEKNLKKSAIINFEDRFEEALVTKSSNKKAKKILNYSPKISIEEGYKEFFNWFMTRN